MMWPLPFMKWCERQFGDTFVVRFRRFCRRLLDLCARPVSLLLAGSGEIRVPWFLKPFYPWMPIRHFMDTRHEVDTLLYAEIARRRTLVEKGDDILSMLIDARD